MLHPRAIHPAGPEKAFGVGIRYKKFADRLRVMFETDNPQFWRLSHHTVAAVAADEKLSPAKLPDELSKDFCQVKETSPVRPWPIVFL